MKKLVSIISAICLSSAVHAQTINNLGSASTLTGSENVPIFQTANPAVKTTTQAIANLAVTSVATSCQASGGTITTTGTISTKWQTSPNAPVVTTPYAIASTDACFSLLLHSGASSLTLAAASSFTGTPYWQINNQSGGSVTLTITTSTLDGASSVTIANGTQIEFYSDGSNYHYIIAGTPTSVTVNSATCTLGSTCNPPSFVPASYVSGNWYQPQPGDVQATAAGPQSVSTQYCVFGGVSNPVTIKALGAYITTGQAGSTAEFGVYSMSGATLTLVDSTASVATTSSSAAATQTVANTTDNLTPDKLYAWCSQWASSGTVATAAIYTTSAAAPMFYLSGVGNSSAANVLGVSGLFCGATFTATFGTWPGSLNMSSATPTCTRVPGIGFQVN